MSESESTTTNSDNNIQQSNQQSESSSDSNINLPINNFKLKGKEINNLENQSKQLLRQAQEKLAENGVFEARQLAEEALRASPRTVAAYDLLAIIFRDYLHNIPGALQFELASGIISKTREKLTMILPDIIQHFGDSKMLKVCVCKIFQFCVDDATKVKFYSYIFKNNYFGDKNRAKVFKIYLLNLKSVQLILQQLGVCDNLHILLQIYTHINQSDINFPFLFEKQFNQEKFLKEMKNLGKQVEFDSQETTSSFVYYKTLEIANLAFKQQQSTRILIELIQLLKSFIPKINTDLHILLIFSTAASELGTRYQELFSYCYEALLKYVNQLQNNNNSQLITDESIILQYLINLNKNNHSQISLKILNILIQKKETPQLLTLHAQILSTLNFKQQAAQQFIKAVNMSMTSQTVEENICIRLQLSQFMKSQNLQLFKQFDILMPNFNNQLKQSLQHLNEKIQLVEKLKQLYNVQQKLNQDESQIDLKLQLENEINQCKQQIQKQQTIDFNNIQYISITNLTYLPIVQNQYVRQFKIAANYQLLQKITEQDTVKAQLLADMRTRAQLAIMIFISEEYNYSWSNVINQQNTFVNKFLNDNNININQDEIINIQQQLNKMIVELITIPIYQVLQFQCLYQTGSQLHYSQQVDQIVSGVIQCKRFQNNTIQCKQYFDKSFSNNHTEQIKEISNVDTIRLYAYGRKNKFYCYQNTQQLIDLFNTNNCSLLKISQFLINYYTKPQVNNNTHSQICTDNQVLFLVFHLIQLNQLQLINLTDFQNKEFNDLLYKYAAQTENAQILYKPLLKLCGQNMSNITLIFQLVKISLINQKHRQNCRKLLERWSQKNPQLQHLNTACLILQIEKHFDSATLLQKLKQLSTVQEYDENLQLHIINLCLQLSSSKTMSKQQKCLLKEEAMLTFSDFIKKQQVITPQFVYNVATILFGQFNQYQLAATLYSQLLNYENIFNNNNQLLELQILQLPQHLYLTVEKDVMLRSAYNLQLIYQITGDYTSAQRIIDEYLNI